MGDFTSSEEHGKIMFSCHLRTQAAKRVAKRIFQRFRKVCKECKDKGGAATK